MSLRRDLWRPALLRAPLSRLLDGGTLDGLEPHWLPASPSLRFLADPFGFMHDGRLQVLAEAYDYRDRHGIIDWLEFDAELRLLGRRTVLREPWHLSYPITAVQDGVRYMLPEAFRSGTLRLYRMGASPAEWQPAARIVLDTVPIDATPWFDGALWWLFYAPDGSRDDKVSTLHVAFAERLEGPWHPHPANPVRRDRASSRPGGTVCVIDGVPVLPVQDCTATYGGAIRALHIHDLTPTRFKAEARAVLAPAAALAPYTAGLHTASAVDGAEGLTLIDAKRLSSPAAGLALAARRAVAAVTRNRLVRPRS